MLLEEEKEKKKTETKRPITPHTYSSCRSVTAQTKDHTAIKYWLIVLIQTGTDRYIQNRFMK